MPAASFADDSPVPARSSLLDESPLVPDLDRLEVMVSEETTVPAVAERRVVGVAERTLCVDRPEVHRVQFRIQLESLRQVGIGQEQLAVSHRVGFACGDHGIATGLIEVLVRDPLAGELRAELRTDAPLARCVRAQ